MATGTTVMDTATIMLTDPVAFITTISEHDRITTTCTGTATTMTPYPTAVAITMTTTIRTAPVMDTRTGMATTEEVPTAMASRFAGSRHAIGSQLDRPANLRLQFACRGAWSSWSSTT